MARNISIKKLDIKKNVGLLSIEREDNGGFKSELQLKALAILLGGYNQYGRNIEINVHRERIIAFTDLLNDIAKDIE